VTPGGASGRIDVARASRLATIEERGYAAPRDRLRRPLRDIRLEAPPGVTLDTSLQDERSFFESLKLSKRA